MTTRRLAQIGKARSRTQPRQRSIPSQAHRVLLGRLVNVRQCHLWGYQNLPPLSNKLSSDWSVQQTQQRSLEDQQHLSLLSNRQCHFHQTSWLQ